MRKRITIEKLAMMIQEGFAEAYERMVPKEDFNAFKKEVKEEFIRTRNELRFEFKEDLFDMEERLGIRWGNRIDHLEDDMRIVKNKLKLA